MEHIGSTAVPGMMAKPIIDLAVRVERHSEVDVLAEPLRGLGWIDVDAGPRTHRVLVRLNGNDRTHIAHFFDADQWDSCNQRILRDWLIEHAEDRARYGQVKVAAAGEVDGRKYTARKTAVIQDIVDRARAAQGLPSVDVWDK